MTTLLQGLTPADLRHLAALLEVREPDGRRDLTPKGLERFAEIVSRGGVPTIGFFRRWSGHD
jgi:hypothetical protein